MKFNVRASYLAAAATCMSTDETRYYLHGVFIEPLREGGVLMVATDGHMLACIHDPQGHAGESAIVSLNFKDKLLKDMAKEIGHRRIRFDLDDTPAVVTKMNSDEAEGFGDDDGVGTGFLKVEKIDGTFPDWRKICPKVSRKGPPEFYAFGMNPNLMARTGAVAKLIGCEPGVMIGHGENKGDPMTLQLTRAPELGFFILMPLRTDKVADHTWLSHRQTTGQ